MIKKQMMALVMMVITIFLVGNMASVFAETDLQKEEPKQEKVTSYSKKQKKPVKKKVNGKMTDTKTQKPKKEDNNTLQEKLDMSKQNDDHLTKQDLKGMNQQKNKKSQEIGK